MTNSPIDLRSELYVHREPWRRDVSVLLVTRDINGREAVGLPIAYHLEDENKSRRGLPVDPTFRLTDDQCQKLISELWHLGYRPAGIVASEGQLGALKDHLADMRKLVFVTDSTPTKGA